MCNNFKIFINLILFLRLLPRVEQAESILEAYRIKVEPNLSSGLLKFTFDVTDDFNPSSFVAQVTSPWSRELINFKLANTNKQHIVDFVNIKPQRFHVNDVLRVTLGNAIETSTINFDYTVQDKPSTFLYIKKFNPYLFESRIPDIDVVTDRGKVMTDTVAEENLNSSELADQVFPSKGKKFLRTALDIALKDGSFNNKLLLTKTSRVETLRDAELSAVDVVRKVIKQDLKLPHLEYKILNADVTGEGVVFEMASAKDSLEIMTQLQLLSRDNFIIARSDYDFYAPRIDIRSSFRR